MEPSYTAAQQLRDLWHDSLLAEYFQSLPDSNIRTIWKLRPLQCGESLTQLSLLGPYTLGSHDDVDEHGLRTEDHVCTIRLRGFPGDEGLVIAGGITPDVAALRCLQGALAVLKKNTASGFDDFDELLSES